MSTIEWNPFISKLPPYNKYSFYEKPNWNIEGIVKKSAQYFNTRTTWHKKQNLIHQKKKSELAERSRRTIESSGGHTEAINLINMEGGHEKSVSKVFSK